MMIKALFLVAFCGLVYGYSVDNARIVGGVDTTIEEHPYQAIVLDKNDKIQCAGSIISNKHILVSAHCQSKANLWVRVGSTNYREGGQLIKVTKQTPNPKYNKKKSQFNVMVIELETEIEFSSTAAPIQLAQQNEEDPEVGTLLTVTGWGWDKMAGGDYSTNLRVANIPLTDRDLCQKTYKYLSNDQLCLGGTNQGMLSGCVGDMSIPAVYNGVQYGLLNKITDCDDPNIPNLYARVASSREWIDSVITA